MLFEVNHSRDFETSCDFVELFMYLQLTLILKIISLWLKVCAYQGMILSVDPQAAANSRFTAENLSTKNPPKKTRPAEFTAEFYLLKICGKNLNNKVKSTPK